jgi:hypothetical protein
MTIPFGELFLLVTALATVIDLIFCIFVMYEVLREWLKL